MSEGRVVDREHGQVAVVRCSRAVELFVCYPRAVSCGTDIVFFGGHGERTVAGVDRQVKHLISVPGVFLFRAESPEPPGLGQGCLDPSFVGIELSPERMDIHGGGLPFNPIEDGVTIGEAGVSGGHGW
jgi:hypothetical protein